MVAANLDVCAWVPLCRLVPSQTDTSEHLVLLYVNIFSDARAVVLAKIVERFSGHSSVAVIELVPISL